MILSIVLTLKRFVRNTHTMYHFIIGLTFYLIMLELLLLYFIRYQNTI